jgi:hypothetical protein
MLREWPGWLRASVASLALFLLVGVGQVLPAFHFALVAHSICAEHGELVHESAAPARDDAALAPAQRAGVPSLVASGHVSHQHEHCGVLALGRVPAVAAAAPADRCLTSSASASLLAGAERAAHVRIALLSYAPKLAPPA